MINSLSSDFEYIKAPNAKALVIDDNKVNLSVAKGLLKLCEIDSDIAESGQEGIDLIEGNEYDIVFMDYLMPEMDGIETTRKIREMGYDQDRLVIIALSASTIDSTREKFTEVGMQDFLSKPINKSELVDMLVKYLPKDKVVDKENEKRKIEGCNRALSELSCIDFDKGISKNNGSVDAYKNFIEILLKNVPMLLKTLEQNEADNKKIGAVTKGLSVILENACVKDLPQTARRICEEANSGSNGYKDIYPDFISNVLNVYSEINEVFKK